MPQQDHISSPLPNRPNNEKYFLIDGIFWTSALDTTFKDIRRYGCVEGCQMIKIATNFTENEWNYAEKRIFCSKAYKPKFFFDRVGTLR